MLFITIGLLAGCSKPSKAADQCYEHLIFDYGPGRAGDYPVCRAFLQNINKFCDEPVPLNRTMIKEGITKLSKPNWSNVVDWRKYFNVVTTARDTMPGETKYQRLEKSFQDGKTKMWIGTLNLDNFGVDETVLRLNSGESVNRGFNMIIPFNLQTGIYDESFDSVINRGSFDALIYDGKTYLMWEKNWQNISRGYEIHISKPHHAGTNPGILSSICVFSYKTDK